MDVTGSAGSSSERRFRRGHSKRRRPSGEPPPLPKELGTSGKVWLALAACVGVIILAVIFANAGDFFDRIDGTMLRYVAKVRTDPTTDIMLAINALGSLWANRILRWGTIISLITFRRWRHLIGFLGVILVSDWIVLRLNLLVQRPRPAGVLMIGPWHGWSFPSRPVAAFATTAIAMCYALVPAGRARFSAKWVAGVAIGLLCGSRLYLGIDHPTDVLAGITLGVAIPLIAFRTFVPNSVFPISYRRGGTAAHLDIGGRRGEAIRTAISEQLGLTVTDMEPFALEGSGGSTPIRFKVAEEDGYLFAKLYSQTHVRADRHYKLARTILYGALEDERSYRSVRNLVEYEDYALRVFRDAGIRVARSFGIVEITPDREYLLVTEFFTGSKEIGEVAADDELIEDGLQLVQNMWEAGLAHRDIKPANLLVKDGHIQVVDLGFAQVRPSPWRQAVDLANMMLILALRSDAQRVYDKALDYFSPGEIAEAFAAVHGVASPTQLRSVMKKDGRDLVGEFRAIAPAREVISIQRWSVRRIGVTSLVFLGLLVGILLVIDNLHQGVL